MPAHYGLIGFPLTHSFSPKWFAEKFAAEGIDATYKAYPLELIESISDLLANYPLRGLNVTIPYKEQVLGYLNELDEAAEAIGAVNCIDIRHGIKKGYNTDVTGFEQSLAPLLQAHHTRALVLGTGGAAKAVHYVLEKLGLTYRTVSRHQSEGVITYDELTEELIASHPLIINTTPLGMAPHTDEAPAIPYHALTEKHLLYDLIYNPDETKFLALGKQQGATIKNGHEMLVRQAEASWEIWKILT
ncbi:MAG: shikimate dehydrogenase [Flavipsychrobacter sp.]|nr:shikimate dehydrogenase [Flavipsychrobacter sp.]